MVLDEVTGDTCAICDSPGAIALHFGARSCKACAAFFRRTVTKRSKYRCIADGKRSGNRCQIHHMLRMTCRACRYQKCIAGGMKRKLVQHRRDSNWKPRKCASDSEDSWLNEKEAVANCERKCDDNAEMRNDKLGSSEFAVHTSGITYEVEANGFSCLPSQHQFQFVPYGFHQASFMSDCQEVSRPENTCGPTAPLQQCSFSASLFERVIDAEKRLNDSRRMVYAMHGATEVFSCNSELPYSIEDLRPMNFADFNGPTNVDLMMMFQYLRSLPFFLSLSSSDKKRTFQYFMAIDSMLTTAYLSMTLGRENHWMVHFNGFYISMKPAPPSGDAPEDAIYLQRFSPEERKKYQLYMPMKLAQYTELCVPFAEINPTFVEYALLKLIALLLRVRGRVSQSGRAVTEEALQQTMHALYVHCIEKGGQQDGSLRFGNVLLQLSPLFQVVSNLIEGYVKIEFFNLSQIDPVMRQILSHHP